jgi:hypothetical protein
MSRLGRLALAAIVLIPFAWMNAEIADSVSTYQLDAAYTCTFTGAICRGRHPNRIIISQRGEL